LYLQAFITHHVNPVLEDLLTALLADRPSNVLHFCISHLCKKAKVPSPVEGTSAGVVGVTEPPPQPDIHDTAAAAVPVGSGQSSFFERLTEAPDDTIIALTSAYKADTSREKVNAVRGAYRTDEGEPYVFPIVRKAEQELANDTTTDKEYLPVDGLHELKAPTQVMLFGSDSAAVREQRIASAQVLSGTGGLRVIGELIRRNVKGCRSVYVSRPTWAIHRQLFEACGLEVVEYDYWDEWSRAIDVQGMIQALKEAEPHSMVVFHACAHNPTGMDPTAKEWDDIIAVVRERRLIPLVDSAYQGYASGDLVRDAQAVRKFADAGECIVVQSFAKNMGLYGERVGMLHVVCSTKPIAQTVLSHIKQTIRPMYSSPPSHGGRLALLLLTKYRTEWESQLADVSGRVASMRRQLREAIEKKGTRGSWEHITQQIGMFSFTGLSESQCEELLTKWHVYMLRNGRLNVAALTSGNVGYVADAIHDVVTNTA